MSSKRRELSLREIRCWCGHDGWANDPATLAIDGKAFQYAGECGQHGAHRLERHEISPAVIEGRSHAGPGPRLGSRGRELVTLFRQWTGAAPSGSARSLRGGRPSREIFSGALQYFESSDDLQVGAANEFLLVR